MVDSKSLTYPRPYTCMQYWNATEDKPKYNEQNSKKIHLSVTVTVTLDVSRSCRLGGCLLGTLNLSRNLTNVLVYSCITSCKCKNASVFCCLKSGGAFLQSEKLNPDFFFLIHTNICKTLADTQPTSPPAPDTPKMQTKLGIVYTEGCASPACLYLGMEVGGEACRLNKSDYELSSVTSWETQVQGSLQAEHFFCCFF